VPRLHGVTVQSNVLFVGNPVRRSSPLGTQNVATTAITGFSRFPLPSFWLSSHVRL
jgi:hypothetical protein